MTLIIESFGFLKQTLSSLKDKINPKKVNQVASLFVLSAILPAMYLPVFASTISDKSEDISKSSLVLDTNGKILKSSSDLNEIMPGESLEQRTLREQAQALAAQKAEAEAKARAQAQVQAQAQQNQKQRETISREKRVYADPSDFDQIYRRAQDAYGVDARILKAVHTVETGRSGSTRITSYAGAQGPMQFLPSTWKRYGVDANGDGSADITNVEDAIFAAAKYLKACGYPDVKKALWGYNPSQSYYNKVMNVAHSLGF